MHEVFIKYNLQFFGEDTSNEGDIIDTGDSNDDDNNTGETGLDASAFADIISEKDKRIEELEAEVTKQKRTIAEMTVRISAGQKTEKTFEENLLGLVGQPARKE